MDLFIEAMNRLRQRSKKIRRLCSMRRIPHGFALMKPAAARKPVLR